MSRYKVAVECGQRWWAWRSWKPSRYSDRFPFVSHRHFVVQETEFFHFVKRSLCVRRIGPIVITKEF